MNNKNNYAIPFKGEEEFKWIASAMMRITNASLDCICTDIDDYAKRFNKYMGQGWILLYGRDCVSTGRIGTSTQQATVDALGAKVTTLAEFAIEWFENSRPSPTIKYAPPAKYAIKYNKYGVIGDYIISNPIEADDKKITVYAQGRGVRTFVLNRITFWQELDPKTVDKFSNIE